MSRESRIQLLKENQEICESLGLMPKVIGLTKYNEASTVDEYISKRDSFDKSRVFFENTDSITAAIKYDDGNCVDFMVFASARNYGGGVWNGAKAQEEDVFLCTDLPMAKTNVQNRYYYPLKGILTMDCSIIRDGKFNPLQEKVNARAFFAAAPNLNVTMRDEGGPDFWTRMKTLTEASFRHSRGFSLIIGAWGCGVFKNDPYEVADMFKKIMPLLQDEYECVVFACPDERLINVFKEVITK